MKRPSGLIAFNGSDDCHLFLYTELSVIGFQMRFIHCFCFR